MKIVKTKKGLAFTLVLLTMVVGIFYWWKFSKNGPDHYYTIEVVELHEGGFGYKILHQDEMLIYQPFVPAVGHNKPFANKEDAIKVAQLVRNKLESGYGFSVSAKEIQELDLSVSY